MIQAPASTAARRVQAGMGLVELVMAMALLAILVGLATPGLFALRANAALNSAANQMLLALHLARSAAMTRGVTAVVCQSDDAEHCRSAEGSSRGYIVFVNGETGRPTQRDQGEEILRRFVVPERLTLVGTRSYTLYHPWPRAGTTVTWSFCDDSATAPTRRVVVSQTGRPRVERDAATSTRSPASCR